MSPVRVNRTVAWGEKFVPESVTVLLSAPAPKLVLSVIAVIVGRAVTSKPLAKVTDPLSGFTTWTAYDPVVDDVPTATVAVREPPFEATVTPDTVTPATALPAPSMTDTTGNVAPALAVLKFDPDR